MPDIHDPIIILQALITIWMRRSVTADEEFSAWLIEAYKYLDQNGLVPDIREVL